MQPKKFIFRASCLLGAVLCVTFGSAMAQSSDTTDRLFKDISNGGSSVEPISIVRETALREVALTVGAQAGLKDRSCEIGKAIDSQAAELDKKFRFNALMMGPGVLPPVISKAVDTVARERKVMRIASLAFNILEPAMLIDVAPTWRNWLYVGLDTRQCSAKVEAPALPAQLRPRDEQERLFVKTELEKAYAAGRQQAQSVFDENLARLERTYKGMRMYYDLYARNMVSAPEIVASTDVVTQEDANTMVVGNTVIRISKDSGFIENHESWRPLAP